MAEKDEQKMLVGWCRSNGIRIIHIPNEGQRNPWTGRDLVAMGLERGVSDLFLPYPRGAYSGLWIEMKHGKNKLTEDQRDWLQFCSGQGYAVYVAYSFEEGRDAVARYLNLNKGDKHGE